MHRRCRHVSYAIECVSFDDQPTRWCQRSCATPEDVEQFIGRKHARLTKDKHGEIPAGPEGNGTHVSEHEIDGQTDAIGFRPSVRYGGRREIYPCAITT